MNKQKMDADLQAAIANKSDPEEKIFLQLLRQVWQIDWTVAPYDIWGHFIAYDVPYFLRFMAMDVGDEEEEHQLIIEWISIRLSMRAKEGSSDWRSKIVGLMDEANQIRAGARQS